MCRYFCIGFIDFMLAGKTLIDYTSLFSPYDFEKNRKIILSYFKWTESWKNQKEFPKATWILSFFIKAKKKKRIYVVCKKVWILQFLFQY